MSNKNFEVHVNPSKFRFLWAKNIPTQSLQMDVGEIYGGMFGADFWLYIKKTPRSWRTVCDECLWGTIDKNGRIEYHFKRTLECVIVTRMLPCFMLLGALICAFVLGETNFLMLLIPAIGLGACNLFHPVRQRCALTSCFMRIVEKSNSSTIEELSID